MDARARELLDGMRNLEVEMAQYIKEKASKLTGRILVYETAGNDFDRFDRKFYLNPSGMIEQDIFISGNEIWNRTTSTIDNFAEEYKQKALKQAVRRLGEELDKLQPALPFE